MMNTLADSAVSVLGAARADLWGEASNSAGRRTDMQYNLTEENSLGAQCLGAVRDATSKAGFSIPWLWRNWER